MGETRGSEMPRPEASTNGSALRNPRSGSPSLRCVGASHAGNATAVATGYKDLHAAFLAELD